jgi:hypothetical protein
VRTTVTRVANLLKRSRFTEWLRLWKPPARDQYGVWAAVAGVLTAIGATLWFATSFGWLVPALGLGCVLCAGYIVLAILFGLKVPPTHADWVAYNDQRLIDFLNLGHVIRAVHTELETALGQLQGDLVNGTYSGIVLRQDEWTKNAATIKNDPVFADVQGVIERAYEAIRVHSERSYEAGTGAAEPEIPYRETEDLKRAIADVAAARDAAATKVDELAVDQP